VEQNHLSTQPKPNTSIDFRIFLIPLELNQGFYALPNSKQLHELHELHELRARTYGVPELHEGDKSGTNPRASRVSGIGHSFPYSGWTRPRAKARRRSRPDSPGWFAGSSPAPSRCKGREAERHHGPGRIRGLSCERRTYLLEQSFWQFLGYVVALGCLWLIVSIAFASFVGNIIHRVNPFDEE